MSRSDKRPRELSEEEHTLWQDVARSIKPLRRMPQRKSPDTNAGPDASPTIAKVRVKPARVEQRGSTSPAVSRSAPPPKPLASLDRRTRQKLARGREEIEARLDLHGMTQSQAHAGLARFLRRSQADGLKFVLIVTGKGVGGQSDARERGVLRRQVPQWLALAEFRDLVLGFETAHVGHGGEGALYVRLRKKR